MSTPLLELEDVTIQYETDSEPITAVSDVSFAIDEKEYFGLVGESGCGKSTIVDTLIGGLDRNGEVVSGTITYRGDEIQDLSEYEWNDVIRWKEIAQIPQGSMNSLDPLKRVRDHALELAAVHTDMGKKEALREFQEVFQTVGLQPERLKDYPYQFSGGMQQRVIIALALFLRPSLILADEPTTALDVIMQDQIFKYLREIKDEYNMSMLLVTHDISLVFESCDRMAIMHGGQLSETGDVVDVFDDPHHPYSILLQRAFPDIRAPKRELETIEGTPPRQFGEIDRCTFADRCPWAVDECVEGAPPLEPVDDAEHRVACIRKDEIRSLAAEDLTERQSPPATED